MFQISSKVYHPQWGEGIILSKAGHGETTVYKIQFKNHMADCYSNVLFDSYTDFAERLAPDYHR